MTTTRDLEGQGAIVTGGCGGIGRAIITALARRGARCVIADIADPTDTLRLVEATGAEVHAAERCDITRPEEVATAARFALDRLGHIDVLVNCAGGGQRVGFLETTDEIWFAQINQNLSGAFFFMRAVLPVMLERGSGAIVNISSISGIIGGLPSKGTQGRSGPAYAVAKAGIIGLTKWAAREYGKHGIRVNAVAPGPVLTSEVMHGYDYGTEDYPIPRWGRPEDMAETVAFLASPAAAYITGEVIKVTGGVGM